MEGLSRALGVGPTIELGGEKLVVSPKILRHYAIIEADIIKQRGNPFDVIRQAKEALVESPEIIREFVTKAFDEARKWRIVTLEDIGMYLETTASGLVMALWLAVRDNNPDKLTFQWVSDAFWDEFERRTRAGGDEAAQKYRDELAAAISQAEGTDEVGNSTGSPSSPEVGADQKSSTGT